MAAARFPLLHSAPPRPSPPPPLPALLPSYPSSRPSAAPRLRFPELRAPRRRLFGGAELQEDSPELEDATFNLAAELFNAADYHRCHDVLEDLWCEAEEPLRTLLHGVLQCAVGFHHLFNQNHRGAMLELGEGLCKLRKMEFDDGPFLEFEKEVAAVLEFLYQTQKELAACSEDICLPMDGSEISYQLLGSFAAGQRLYHLDNNQDGVAYIKFLNYPRTSDEVKVKIPTLHAKEEDLKACGYGL